MKKSFWRRESKIKHSPTNSTKKKEGKISSDQKIITLYNNKKFKQNGNTIIKPGFGNITLFSDVNDPSKTTKILNVWASFSKLTNHHEKIVKEFLNSCFALSKFSRTDIVKLQTLIGPNFKKIADIDPIDPLKLSYINLSFTIQEAETIKQALEKINTHEAKALSSKLQIETESYVAGDFNCHIAPIAAVEQNITTSATVSTFRANQRQGACAIDGIFYSARDKNGKIIVKQTELIPINPDTGKAFTKIDLKPLKNMPTPQNEEINTFRMIMCVDDHYEKEKSFFGKTVFEYETHLRENMNMIVGDVFVRPARNLNNRPGIAIAFKASQINSTPYSEIKKKYRNDFQFDETANNNQGHPYYIIYAPEDKVSLLASLMPGFQDLNYKCRYKMLQEHLLKESKSLSWNTKGAFFKSSEKVLPKDKDYGNLTFKNFPTHINLIMQQLTRIARNQISNEDALKNIVKINIKALDAWHFNTRSPFTAQFYSGDLLFKYLGIHADNSIKAINEYINDNFYGKEKKAFNFSGIPHHVEKMHKIIEDSENKYNNDSQQKLIDIFKIAVSAEEDLNPSIFRKKFTTNFYKNQIYALLKINPVNFDAQPKNTISISHSPQNSI